MPLRHQRPRRRCDKPSKNASAYQSGNIDSRPGTQHRASRGPLAPKRRGRERARKGAANSLMFWIDLPKETEQLRARRRGGYQGPNRRRFLGEFMRGLDPGRQSLLRSSRGTRFRDDAERLTSFRSTVLAPLISGRQMFVNAPAIENEFRHHEVFQRLMSFPLMPFTIWLGKNRHRLCER
jgi:hypothetical protein